MADAAKKIRLSARAYALATKLGELGARQKPVDVTSEMVGPPLAELVAKKVVKRSGMTMGRYGKKGTVKLIHAANEIERAPDRASGAAPAATPAASSARVAPHGVSGPEMSALRRVLADHVKVRTYLDAVSDESQRRFEQRRQEALTDVEVSRAIKGLRGDKLIEKMHEMEKLHTLSFKQYLLLPQEHGGLGFDPVLVDLLGIPAVGTDTPDGPRRQ